MITHDNSFGGISFDVSGTVVSLLDDVLAGATETREVTSFTLTANNGNIRYLVGDGTPSSTYGHVLLDGQSQRFDGSELPLVKLIASDGLGPVAATYSDRSWNTIS